jgi:hypothetical protein
MAASISFAGCALILVILLETALVVGRSLLANDIAQQKG